MPKVKFEKLENLISGLNYEDREVLEKACDILYGVQMEFGNRMVLQDVCTGEVTEVSELARVRGILSMFANAHTLQMSIKQSMGRLHKKQPVFLYIFTY